MLEQSSTAEIDGLSVADPPVPTGKVHRTFDAAHFNEVANHPEVHRWLFADGEVDLSELVGNPQNVALATDGGGFLCVKQSEAIYEVHSLFIPSARRHTRAAMADGMAYMFLRTDCHRLITKVPSLNDAAAALAAKGGFREWFRRIDGRCGETAYLTLEIDDWIQSNPSLEADGEWFHERLEQAKLEAGSTLPAHDHDGSHERAVGAAVQMLRKGNAGKALGTYNRWASFAGYVPIGLLSVQPIMLDVGDAIIEIAGDDFEVVKCL